MKKIMQSSFWKGFAAMAILIGLCALLAPAPVLAGGMPSSQLRLPFGSSYGVNGGDFVSSNSPYGGVSGLNSYYSYYIEVPPSTGNLTVDIYDANIYSTLDENHGSGLDTSVTYTLYDPSGASRATLTCAANTACGTDAGWYTFANITDSVTAGHWEVRIKMGAGTSVNAYAVRARDTSASNAKELNMYALPFDIVGAQGANGYSRVSNLYPYITSGCDFKSNGWDWDYSSATLGGGYVNFTSRLGYSTGNLSQTTGDNAWYTNTITSASNTAVSCADYGIWSANLSIKVHNGISNIVTYYIGDYSSTAASTTSPTSKPTNAFRMYMPTYNSGGTAGAPVKPYVTQAVYLVSTAANGDRTLRIVVSVVNPTLFPITFSSANLVSAYVPVSASVTYMGNEQASQGTTPSYSSSTHLVTWNPGTVAARIDATHPTYAEMSYDIKVASGTADGTRLTGYINGTTDSNGTKATFVDETCSGASPACSGTQLTRATYTFGPLCGLTLGTMSTLATLSSFDAYVVGGKVVVEWATSSEINTVGFYLKRLDSSTGEYVSVTDRMLPTAFNSHRAGLYRLVDTGASAGAQTTYMLVEKESNGATRNYGPFVVTPGSRANASPMATNFSRQSLQMSAVKGISKSNMVSATAGSASMIRAVVVKGDKIRIAVTEDGVYSISASTIGSLLGISTAQAANLIKNNLLTLSNKGKTVAYRPDTAHARILFYGQAITSNFTSENIYWLEKGKGVVMGAKGSGAAPATDPGSFSHTKHFEQNLIDAPALVSDPESDYWYWDYIVGGDADNGTKTFNLQVSGRSTEGTAGLSVKLQGAYDVQQQAQFYLNDHYLGEASWDGLTSKTASLSFSSSLLNEGANSLKITGLGDSLFYLNSADLTYTRFYKADGNSLSFTAGQSAVTVTGFSGSSIRVFDITDPAHPNAVNITINNNSVGFMPASASGNYIAVAESAIRTVTGASGYKTPTIFKGKAGATYVVITSEELKAAASTLAAFRSHLGHSTMVVTVDQIMNEFNYGIYSPAAIKNFLIYAYKNWSNKPQYVLLAGGGTYDYKDYLGKGGQQVPPAMAPTPDGLAPSDNYYVNINSDHIPDIAIGRLPASTPAELSGMVSKIVSYESGSGTALVNKALLVADIPDTGGDFGSDIDSVATVFPATVTVSKLYHADYPDATNMNSALLQGINSGEVFMSYFGHAGVDRLSQDGILTVADVESMTNLSKLPVMSAMTCVIGNFAVPGFTSLGEALILNKAGGAAAIWTSTGMSDDKQALLLDKAFFSGAFDGSSQTVGELVINAIKNANLGSDYQYILDTYVILGDPALRVKGLKKFKAAVADKRVRNDRTP
jgi:hypothetical protein